MTESERRLAEIYSYWLDECYLDDYSRSFFAWLDETIYGPEAKKIIQTLVKQYIREEL